MSEVYEWSTNADDNNSPAPNGFPEGMPPSGVNNAAREMMAAIRKSVTWVSLIPSGAAGDDTAQIQAKLASGATHIFAPAGTYRFTSQIVIPPWVTLRGEGFGTVAGNAATIFLKDGNFNGIVVSGGASLRDLSVEGHTGNGGDGVHILGGRSFVQNVSSFAHGRDGFKIGDYSVSTQNTNLFRCYNLISRSNTRHGVFVSHEGETVTPDANAGLISGLEATGNGGDGLKIGEAIDNTFINIVSQSNTGYGVHFAQYAKGNYLPIAYTETNTAGGIILDSGADRNYVFGYRSGGTNDDITNNGTDNLVVGRYGSITPVPLFSAATGFEDLLLIERTTSGRWQMKKEATSRRLLLQLIGTSANGDVLITNTGGGASGIRFSTDTFGVAMRDIKKRTSTLNFTSIPAQSTAEVTTTITGVDNTYDVVAIPAHAIPAGITCQAYWNGSNLTVRCANLTSGAVVVNGSFTVIATKYAT